MKNGPFWTIGELGEAVTAALAEGYGGPPNGRVRDVPDRRTIRYYTTLGLLDRPAEMQGRTALYGRRHLMQLVAIKKLQARGLSLAEVQRTLVGQPDAVLERLAELRPGPGPGPEQGPGPGRPAAPSTTPSAPARSARAADFWRTVPAPPPEHPGPLGALESFQGVHLAEGVTLLLAPSRPLDADDLRSLRAAAAPLLALLTRRRLTPRRTEEETR
jgi:DNA-binding transcriptional MerR regulator